MIAFQGIKIFDYEELQPVARHPCEVALVFSVLTTQGKADWNGDDQDQSTITSWPSYVAP